MSPQDASRLVGNDICDRLRHDIERHIDICTELATENERLRTQLTRIRCISAMTDSEWAMREIRDVLWGYRP